MLGIEIGILDFLYWYYVCDFGVIEKWKYLRGMYRNVWLYLLCLFFSLCFHSKNRLTVALCNSLLISGLFDHLTTKREKIAIENSEENSINVLIGISCYRADLNLVKGPPIRLTKLRSLSRVICACLEFVVSIPEVLIPSTDHEILHPNKPRINRIKR